MCIRDSACLTAADATHLEMVWLALDDEGARTHAHGECPCSISSSEIVTRGIDDEVGGAAPIDCHAGQAPGYERPAIDSCPLLQSLGDGHTPVDASSEWAADEDVELPEDGAQPAIEHIDPALDVSVGAPGSVGPVSYTHLTLPTNREV